MTGRRTHTTELTTDERRLIQMFRACDAYSRQIVLNVAAVMVEQTQKERERIAAERRGALRIVDGCGTDCGTGVAQPLPAETPECGTDCGTD